jgi:threonine/homoserine/homoserine lactone efflux protein
MDINYFLNGLAIGFSLAVPVGPVGVLCIRRTLTQGGRKGLIVGLSAASADMVYGLVAAFGVTLISNFITAQQQWIRLFGGILLLGLGYRTFHSHPTTEKVEDSFNGHTRAFISSFFLTLTNPMTMFAFAAVFAGIGLERILGDHWSASLLVAGIFLGSLSWFSLLTLLTYIFKEKITTRGLILVNKIAGGLLTLFGFVALWTGLTGF